MFDEILRQLTSASALQCCRIPISVNKLVPWCAWLLSGAVEIPGLRIQDRSQPSLPKTWYPIELYQLDGHTHNRANYQVIEQ